MNSIIYKHIIRPTGLRFFGISATKFSSDQEIIHLPDNPSIKIPVYSASPNEPIEKQRSRLLYQSRKRGILENDLLLSTFASRNLDKFTKQQLNDYDKLINTARNDWDIYYWITGKEPTPKEFDSDIMEMLKQHVKSNKGLRIRQPDLL